MIEKIFIVGGQGKMGSSFTRELRQIGAEVHVADKDTPEKEWLAKLENYQLIILSVPIEKTPSIIRKIKPHVHEEQLLTDFTSVKELTIPETIKLKCAVISSHPLFGQNTSFKGQNILLMPIKPKQFFQPLKKLYGMLGLKVFVIDNWKKHDQYMAYIQSLIHFMHITFAKTMENSGLDLDLIDAICSPVYKAHFSLCCRILSRDPKLYSHIIVDNPKSREVINSYLQISREYFASIEHENPQFLIEQINESKKAFGDLTEEYSKISDYLVSKLSNFKQ